MKRLLFGSALAVVVVLAPAAFAQSRSVPAAKAPPVAQAPLKPALVLAKPGQAPKALTEKQRIDYLNAGANNGGAQFGSAKPVVYIANTPETLKLQAKAREMEAGRKPVLLGPPSSPNLPAIVLPSKK
jgi:hypothetical protein